LSIVIATNISFCMPILLLWTGFRVPTRYWKYWKSIEFQNRFSRPWKSVEFYQNIH